MQSEVKSSLLWGVVGGLAFLVLVQAYQLFSNQFASIELVVGVAVVVSVVTGTAAHLIRPRLRARSTKWQ